MKYIFRLFHKQVMAYAFAQQRKNKGFEGTEFCFIDSKGNRYFKYIDDMDMPIERKAKVEQFLIELDAKLSNRELRQFIEALKTEIDNVINTANQKGKISGLARISLIIEEMERRDKMILHPELLMDIAAVTYIREDEQPERYDEEIHRQKVDQFHIDSKGGLYDFFYKSGLAAFMPTFKDMQTNFKEYMQEAEIMMKQTQKFLTSILEEESSKKGNVITN